ncbi:MAG: 30S ribosomal protein S18 [Coxiellaceae bacterium]|jgi:small subunit ribosomal protein S18|nr:30S ribosomal protein S18 [Coxiellaceae bacterium]
MTDEKVKVVSNKDPEIDYKNLGLLKASVLESGRIISGRITDVVPWKQRKIAKAVKLARYLALLPYTDQH